MAGETEWRRLGIGSPTRLARWALRAALPLAALAATSVGLPILVTGSVTAGNPELLAVGLVLGLTLWLLVALPDSFLSHRDAWVDEARGVIRFWGARDYPLSEISVARVTTRWGRTRLVIGVDEGPWVALSQDDNAGRWFCDERIDWERLERILPRTAIPEAAGPRRGALGRASATALAGELATA